MRKTIAIFAALSALLLALPAGAAHEDNNPSEKVRSYSFGLDVVADNTDGATGQARLKALPNGKIQVKITASGLAPNQVHAQHLHGIIDGDEVIRGECPTIDADGTLGRPVDGLIDTVEGVPSYGLVRVSLTTSGSTDASEGLAVDRFPVADENGVLEYERNFTPSNELVWENLADFEVVVHGVDLNGNGMYDFEFGPSSLTDAFPLEATIPAICGGLGS